MSDSRRFQHTIAESVCVEGFGYWSGLDVRVEFRPAPVNSGIVFIRADQEPSGRIEAVVANRVEVPRRTTLQSGETTVEMVEHVMAALAGLQIDNCEIRVDQAEMPGCDGSSLPFVEALLSAGRVAQNADRACLVVTEARRVGDETCWVETLPGLTDRLSIRYVLDYGDHGPIGRQAMDLELSPETFCDELAAARTFILEHEAAWLREQGLGHRVTCQDLLVFDQNGPVDNPLRFPDECVRHKTLDLIGDLALAGCDLVGRIVAYRSGHRLNADLVRSLIHESAGACDQCRYA